MTEPQMPPVGDTFVPSADPATAARRSENVGPNVCRATATAALMQAQQDEMEGLSEPLQQLGFSPAAEVLLDVTGASRAIYDALLLEPEELTSDDTRLSAWTGLNETGDSSPAWQFLMALLASPEERESAAAAASILSLRSASQALAAFDVRPNALQYLDFWPDLLGFLPPGVTGGFAPFEYEDLDVDVGEGEQFTPWEPQLWAYYFQAAARLFLRRRTRSAAEAAPGIAALLAEARLRWAARSTDPITRAFAAAAALRPETGASWLGERPQTQPPATATVVSTIVHGTGAWKGTWWRPRPDNFHTYIRGNYRGNLYNEGARFSWSGALSSAQRVLAAEDLVDWANDRSAGGLETLFAHSYGGEVAAMAATALGNVDEVVLLSVPANKIVRDFADAGVSRVVDVRLPLDPVLTLVDRRQRIPGIEPVLLQWRLDHSASHNPDVWDREDVARRIGWQPI